MLTADAIPECRGGAEPIAFAVSSATMTASPSPKTRTGGGRPGGLSPDPDQLLVAERPGAQPQVLAGVLDIDPDLFLGRRIVSRSREPRRGPPAAAGGVDNQVGGNDFLAAAAAWGQDPGAGDPVAGRGGGQPGHLAPVLYRHLAEGLDSAADLTFQIWSADQVGQVVRFAITAQQVTAHREPQLPEVARHRHPRRHPGGEHPGEQLGQDLRAAGQQRVRVPALRHRRRLTPHAGSGSRSITVTRW